MGFHELVGRGSLVARFTSVTVYEAHGIALQNNFLDVREGCIADTNYRIALTKSINAGCQRLTGDDFTESEAKWLKEKGTEGPFVLITAGPTGCIRCEAGRMRRMPDNSIDTHGCFPGLRETLKSLEDLLLPPVVSTATIALNKLGRHVALRKLDYASAGRTADGTVIRDIRLDVIGVMTTFHLLEASQASEILDVLIERAPRLNQRAAQHFARGTAEKDQLKRFLCFFLSLEVETHAAFRRIDHAQQLNTHIFRDGTSAPRPSIADLISLSINNWNSLFDRFVWCATCAWPSITDEDIKLFKELKKTRDGIAHGYISEPPANSARKAELLAQKILWNQGASDA